MHRLLARTVERILGTSSEELVTIISEILEQSLPQDYHWPGNVWELEQCTRRILLKRGYEGDMGGRESDEAERSLRQSGRAVLQQRSCLASIVHKIKPPKRIAKRSVSPSPCLLLEN